MGKGINIIISVLILFCFGCKKNDTLDSDEDSSSGTTYSQSSGTALLDSKTYSSSTADLSAVKVTGGTLTLTNSAISSTGNTSSSDNSSFYRSVKIFFTELKVL
jgi:hypothetical protein